jgi:hypothetical protein
VRLSAAQSHVSNVWQGTQFYAAPEQTEQVTRNYRAPGSEVCLGSSMYVVVARAFGC